MQKSLYEQLKTYINIFPIQDYINDPDPLLTIGGTRPDLLDSDSKCDEEVKDLIIQRYFHVMMPFIWGSDNEEFTPSYQWSCGSRSWLPEDMDEHELGRMKQLLEDIIQDQECYFLKPYLQARIAHLIISNSIEKKKGKYALSAVDAYVSIASSMINEMYKKIIGKN
ncbi:hypothetical protein Cyrtocomes_01078 [Candidatus Cyrtobacter comes]|uniref:DUF7380 domain-containing protein n=1 Tax=Candidatus Cyrtobacter comes TaxID=675776 RepID=A0ABU5L983_9RICK|nr:hypothetical protein [Candidatus Cyrtobacter comes]MDZ5762686.1 hypothetical protein [Candidatus Cyrtobacter comes]